MRGDSAVDATVTWSEEPVRIVPCDPDWGLRFEEGRTLLEGAIGEWAVGGIHHVGSTSVPLPDPPISSSPACALPPRTAGGLCGRKLLA
jgi:GrpB-like predicted nucleotidyltransferase (UPF0157 family)